MSVHITYPPDWIGVPGFGDGALFDSSAEWAEMLADELLTEFGIAPPPAERQALVGALTIMGAGTKERGASASYIHYPAWGSPLELVDVVLLDRSVVGDASAHEVAGSNEPDLLRPATVTEIVNASGLSGSLVIRHAPMDDETTGVVSLRASCALDVGDGFVVLGTATTDLAAFESFRPHFLALIDGVTVQAE
jgi:hypothetical protein